MQEMNAQEVETVGGALTFSDAAGFALIGIGMTAAGIAAAPLLAGFAVTVGVGLLVGNAVYGNNN